MGSTLRILILVLCVVAFAAPVPAVSPLPFIGLTPCRIADTRNPPGPYGAPALTGGTPRNFTLAGQCGIQGSAEAVSLNITVTNTVGAGFLLIFPQGGVQPVVSTLNYVAGQTVANAALVPLGGGGVTVIAGVSGFDLIIDVNGYYGSPAADSENVFLGSNAGNATMSGSQNTALGELALSGNVGGVNNIAVGFQAGRFTNGNSNIVIGNAGVGGESATIRIGDQAVHTDTFIGGINAAISAGGVTVFANSAGKLGTNNSSRRFKQDIREIGEASDGLMRLRPVAFRYKPEFDPKGFTEYGLIAEEVAEVYPELVACDSDGEPLAVRYHLVNALLLNQVQKQERTIESQERRIEKQTETIEELQARLARLEMRLTAEPRP